MRSSLPIPALAFLALALAGCEMQPVVSNIAPPPAVEAETPTAETKVAETVSETDDGAGVPEIVLEAEPETAIEETEAIVDAAAEKDDPPAKTADTSQADTTEPVTAPDIPAAKAEDTVEVTGIAQTGAGVPEIVLEAEPETAIEETEAIVDAAAEKDDPPAKTADTSQADTTEPVTAPDIPAAKAEEELQQTGDLAMAAPPLPLPPPPPPPPPSPPELAPSSLIGISIPTLQSRLGEADFTRTEGEVETWQYRLETCVVDYFLVVDSDATQIVSWAWRAPVIGAQIDETACRRALAGRDSTS